MRYNLKHSATFFFSCAVLFSLCISAFSQLPGQIVFFGRDFVTNALSTNEVYDLWKDIHYSVYGEDVSTNVWGRNFRSFLQHQIDIGALPPYQFAISDFPLYTLQDSWPSLGNTSRWFGVEFLGSWPVFLLPRGKEHSNHLDYATPDWCSLSTYVNTLYNSGFQLFDFLPTVITNALFEERVPWWTASLRVEHGALTSSSGKMSLPVTRLFFVCPYYPAWWALSGSQYLVDYEAALDLRGDSLGDDAPFFEYDGYVLYSTNKVHLLQKVRFHGEM